MRKLNHASFCSVLLLIAKPVCLFQLFIFNQNFREDSRRSRSADVNDNEVKLLDSPEGRYNCWNWPDFYLQESVNHKLAFTSDHT